MLDAQEPPGEKLEATERVMCAMLLLEQRNIVNQD
jgi:hypothetical protein